MLKKQIPGINNFIKKYNLIVLREVFIFAVITLAIHFGWRFWAYHYHFAPLAYFVNSARHFMANRVFNESTWFISNVLQIDITKLKNTMYFENNSYIGINSSCSGMKQITQFVLLMIIYPGPWRKKLWYIPLGAFIVHLTNLFRIIGLSVIITHWAPYWKFSHDYLFRPFFYVVIFSMWVIWVEYFYKKDSLHKTDPGVSEQAVTKGN